MWMCSMHMEIWRCTDIDGRKSNILWLFFSKNTAKPLYDVISLLQNTHKRHLRACLRVWGMGWPVWVNSLWPGDAIWQQGSGSTLVMACCLMTPSHYLNQCWLIIKGVLLFCLTWAHQWGGWGCEVSCGGHHRPRGKTTTGSALDGAVFDIAQILAYLVHNMSRSQLYLGFGHFGWLPSFFGQ